jgi:hypothetical protein
VAASFAVLGRILMLVTWLLTGAFDTVFNTWIFPLLGLIFLPFATIAYTIGELGDAGVVGMIFMVGLGFGLDAASFTLAASRRRY